MSCGKGLSLDPLEPSAGDKYDAADGQEADTADAAAEDASFDEPDSREGDAPDASDAFDQSVDSYADAPEARPDLSADGDGAVDGRDDVSIDSDGSRDDVSDVQTEDDVEDAPIDANVEAGDGCTVACGWPEADYYVDASVAMDGDGSKFSPFKTITRAVEAHRAPPAQAKRAYVAPGVYDRTLGEKFPLELRGLSLQGAGQNATFVVGTGILDHAGDGGSFYGQYSVTIVAGDRDLPTTIADLSVRPENPVPTLNYFGIFCDRGSATGEVAPPAGQTIVDRATVGPGYHASILAGTSTTLTNVTGCNVLVRSSVLTGGWAGVRANGCKPTGVSVPVMVEMGGDEPSKGNEISWMQAPDDAASGASLEGCVNRSRFQNNSFVDSSYAIRIERGLGTSSSVDVITLRDNTFERLAAGGVVVTGTGVRVDELSGNRFRQITRGLTQPLAAPAIALSIDLRYLGKVRNNQFVGNDFGILLAVAQATSGQAPDFGTVADPGNNVFRCNSALRSSGADLAFQGTMNPAATWSGTVHLAGNAWDHASPTVLSDDPIPNGCDISTIRAPNVTLDLQNGSLSNLACPNDRVPGR
ncbi:MAG: DUF1565 domain-containing protein [Polyangiaceae bacterium]